MGDLARRGSSAAAKIGSRTSSSAAETDFSRTYDFDWADLPQAITEAVPDAGAALAACQLDDDDQTVRRRRGSGEFWQPARIWRATRAGVTLMTLRRPLKELGAKRFSRSGPLELVDVTFYAAAEPPARRHGLVTELPTTGHPSHPSSASAAPVDTIDYLPGVVADEVRSLVSAPSYAHSVFLQYTSSAGLPSRQTIELIRMSDLAAVVLRASRERETLPSGIEAGEAQRILAAEPWGITRWSYHLGEGSSGLPAQR